MKHELPLPAARLFAPAMHPLAPSSCSGPPARAVLCPLQANPAIVFMGMPACSLAGWLSGCVCVCLGELHAMRFKRHVPPPVPLRRRAHLWPGRARRQHCDGCSARHGGEWGAGAQMGAAARAAAGLGQSLLQALRGRTALAHVGIASYRTLAELSSAPSISLPWTSSRWVPGRRQHT
jgi:hypothetical protein